MATLDKNSEDYTRSYQRFASNSAISLSSNSSSARSISESRLKTMLQDPVKNGVSVAGLSKYMKQVNGMYKNIIRYMSSLLTYDHLLYPILEDPFNFSDNPQDIQLAFNQTAIFIERYNIKYYTPQFVEKIFTSGSTYLYKLEDSKGISYMEMPHNLCRIGYVEDGVYRFQIDVTKLNDTLIEYYPKEIQNAYTGYKNGKTDELIESKWYQVSDKGVAFTLDTDVLIQGGISMPPLASALLDAIKIENAKANMEEVDKLENSKIVHSKIETDDRGRPLMDLPVVMEYHNALKKNLPDGSVAITNPFETKSISLNGTGSDGKFTLLDKTVEQLYNDSGVSMMLFAGDGKSSQALESSKKVDCQWLYAYVLPMFANYYNYELKKASKKGSTQWKIKFLNVSYFDQSEAIKTAKDQLSFGGSRLEYLAYTGMTPLQVSNMLVFEQQMLDIDKIMVAKQTSYTQSSKESSNSESEAGRPEVDSPTDTTVRIKDSQ